jgi:hypothetical protein
MVERRAISAAVWVATMPAFHFLPSFSHSGQARASWIGAGAACRLGEREKLQVFAGWRLAGKENGGLLWGGGRRHAEFAKKCQVFTGCGLAGMHNN